MLRVSASGGKLPSTWEIAFVVAFSACGGSIEQDAGLGPSGAKAIDATTADATDSDTPLDSASWDGASAPEDASHGHSCVPFPCAQAGYACGKNAAGCGGSRHCATQHCGSPS